MPTFATPDPIAARVEVAGARVRITASDRTDTVVTVEPIDETSRKDVRVAQRTEVGFADGRLSVGTTVSGNRNGSVAITIDLPTGSDLAAYLAHSEVRADGSYGTCGLHLASGRVLLDRIDALRANVTSGEVAIGHVVGGAEVDLGSGSRDFDIDRADGNVVARASDGAIRIGRMTRGRARLTSGSGNVEVGIAEGAAASVDVDSERGAVHTFVSSRGEPGPADEEVAVHARSRSGDVIVRRAAHRDPDGSHRTPDGTRRTPDGAR